MPNDLEFVREVDRLLRTHGLDVWLAGGWAQELHGLTPPRAHHDVDLLLQAPSFAELDRFVVEAPHLEEIVAKRFAHKRAFELTGTMVELILVDADLTTTFWGEHRYGWPPDTFADDPPARGERPRLVSRAALDHYRRHRPPGRPGA